MSESARITDVRFSAAPRRDLRSGLLGFISLEYSGLKLDGIALRRSATGKLVLSFPERRDAYGEVHDVVRPTDDASRCQIESAVFSALGLDPQHNRDEARP